MKKFRFQKLPRNLLVPMRPHRLFNLVADELVRQFEGPTGVEADFIECAPFPAQVVYWLWRFSCEAGIGGIDVFLLNHLGIYAPQIYESLEVVGATGLMRRIEAAVPHALRSHPDFGRLKDKSWYDQFSPVPEFPSLESVNSGVYAMINAISKPVEEFIRSNAGELFAPE